MFIYSTSIAPLVADAPAWQRPFLGYMLVDQNYAAVMTQARFRDDVDIVPYYVGAWAALASVWQVTSIAGALLGPVIPPSWGLEFAVPLVFLAMLAPSLSNKTAVGVAVVTGVGAAVLVPLLPMQSGLIVALLGGMAYGAWRDAVAPAEGGDQMSATAQFWLLIVTARRRARGRCAASRSCCTGASRTRRGSSGCSSTCRWRRSPRSSCPGRST